MEDASNTVQILVACATQGIRFSSINRLRWGGTKETGSQMKVCAMYSIRFTWMNCLWLGNTKEMVSQIKVCAMYDMRFTRMNCLHWDKRTETVQYNKYHKYGKVQIQRLQCPNSNCVATPSDGALRRHPRTLTALRTQSGVEDAGGERGIVCVARMGGAAARRRH